MRRIILVVPVLAIACIGCGRPPAPPAGLARDIALPREVEVVEDRVPRRGTLAGILRAHAVAEPLAQSTLAAVREVFDPRALREGHPYKLVRTLDGLLRRFEYHIDNDRFLRIVGGGEAVEAEVVPYVKEAEVASVTATIDADRPSLVGALGAEGQRVDLALSLAEIFAGQVDFENDLQPGDQIRVLFEQYKRDARFAGYGAILAAELTNEGRTIRAFRFTPRAGEAAGKAAYFDEQGRSLNRFFLRSPLRFNPRVTSGFSRRRLHPVLRRYRPHLGVDYGAPAGAPVVAVASGTVVSAGYAGGAGRMVRIRHANGYESAYLHLSSIASGVRPGRRVSQGALIGRVGSSGLATGPHLDYRLRKNGVYVNPLAEHRKLPPGAPIPPSLLPAFTAERDRAAEALEEGPEPTVVAVDDQDG
jgi:murein DD-endopeptidase MepM/ murein hydrolase activator NlpD